MSMLIKDEERERLFKWWLELLDNSGRRAQLKRCASPEEAALIPETFKVKTILPKASIEACATIAGILSALKKECLSVSLPLGKQLAVEKNSRPLFSETRFRQLLSSKTWNELYTHLRRAVGILDGMVNPIPLTEFILRWDWEAKYAATQAPGKSLVFELSRDYYLANSNQ